MSNHIFEAYRSILKLIEYTSTSNNQNIFDIPKKLFNVEVRDERFEDNEPRSFKGLRKTFCKERWSRSFLRTAKLFVVIYNLFQTLPRSMNSHKKVSYFKKE